MIEKSKKWKCGREKEENTSKTGKNAVKYIPLPWALVISCKPETVWVEFNFITEDRLTKGLL